MFQLTVFRGSFFKILLQIQQEFFFLSTCKHRQAKCCLFLGICWCSCLILRKNVIFWNYHETRSHFETRPKTVNIQGYSELREPIRRRENYCSLIWWILILIVFVSVVLGEELKFFDQSQMQDLAFMNTVEHILCSSCQGRGLKTKAFIRPGKVFGSNQWLIPGGDC